jgi:hypothetical protein
MFRGHVLDLELQVLQMTLAAFSECPLGIAVLLATALENLSEEIREMANFR